jgi:hypothetical protein
VEQHGAEVPDPAHGLREWLQSVRLVGIGLSSAAFDTRSSAHRMLVTLDHAARTEERLLAALGARVVVPAEHFFVTDVQGPLVDGEQERARRWGGTLGQLVASRYATP